MRLKRHKDYKRYMNMYCQTFHFRKPYQVIVDGDFIQAALDQRMDLRTMIPNVLCDASKQMVTPCTMANLKARGEDYSGAFLSSKRFEKRRCKHQEAVDESLCISQIISTTNPHNYVVGTQSKKLRVELAKVPGVPLLYINRANMILEPPSDASVTTSKKIEADKTHASSKELNTLKAVKVTSKGKVSVDPKLVKKIDEKKESKKQKLELKKAKILKKRLGPKEPNPLSVKKKKKPTEATVAKSTDGSTTESKKRPAESSEATTEGGASEKKKRRRRKPKSASSATTAAADGSESS